ncbi:class I SAM-dependent methyltransferase [Streptomyces sioyaensis]|uniref:class I SAM-dependent methyltransferase n=1 Tax=Streptomyces sioyaensis TaxID=67364 RepID=UPI0033D3E805
MTPVADRLAALLAGPFPDGLPVRLRAWDGSEAGPPDAPVVVLRARRALRRLLWQPDELGLAQAYIAGELDVDGDLAEGLSRVWPAVRDSGPARTAPGPRQLAAMAVTALRLGALGPRPPAPGAPQARLRGALHSTGRDRAAISHHYDLSNDWYALLLDETMAYSCGYWTRPDDPSYGPADAQRDKLELICRKLGLFPGARLLDIGCGWGSLSLYAAREFQAQVTAVTLSREQHDHVAARIAREGLGELVGEPTARVWRLYLAGSGLAFRERRMGVDQILAVRPTAEGEAAMPPTPYDWYVSGGWG